MDEFEALEFEALGELEDLEELEDWELEDLGEFEDEEDFEDWELEGLGEFEDWELEDLGQLEGLIYETPTRRRRRPRRRRPRRPKPITMPPTVITVRPVAVLDRFCFNEASPNLRHVREIRALARRLVRSRRRIRTVRLVGHTDNVGSKASNLKLGMRRARWVGRLLRGFIRRLNPRVASRVRIVPQSLGERRPTAPNSTEAGRARNRRVQVFFQ